MTATLHGPWTDCNRRNHWKKEYKKDEACTVVLDEGSHRSNERVFRTFNARSTHVQRTRPADCTVFRIAIGAVQYSGSTLRSVQENVCFAELSLRNPDTQLFSSDKRRLAAASGALGILIILGNLGQPYSNHLSRITTSHVTSQCCVTFTLSCRSSNLPGPAARIARKMRKRQVFSKESWHLLTSLDISWLSKSYNSYNCFNSDYSSLLTSHVSLSESSQVNSMGLRRWTSEALRWANFAFVADGESSKSPNGEPLLHRNIRIHLDTHLMTV